MRTRSQTPATETVIATASALPTRKRARVETEIEALKAALEEIRQMREKRLRREEENFAIQRRHEEELQQLRQQLSPSNFRISDNSAGGGESASAYRRMDVENPNFRTRTDIGYKLKPDTFDGTVPVTEFFAQFDLIARTNGWDENSKTVALVFSLRGKTRSVLETARDLTNLQYSELKSKLELRFGAGAHAQNFYTQFTSRRQKYGEDFASFGSELEKMSRLAYPECSYEIRDRIACVQFISSISDNYIRRTLQMENQTSLNSAVERAKTLKVI